MTTAIDTTFAPDALALDADTDAWIQQLAARLGRDHRQPIL